MYHKYEKLFCLLLFGTSDASAKGSYSAIRDNSLRADAIVWLGK